MGKLTWVSNGVLVFAGLAGFACSQEAHEPTKVGTAQVELRSDLVLPETPDSPTGLSAEKDPNHSDPSANSVLTIQRDEWLPTLLKDRDTQKNSAQGGDAHVQSWTFADKHWVRAGKGFGVAAKEMVPSGSIHPDDASYYAPAVTLKSYPEASEHLEPIAEPFKSRKPLVFHSGATGFAHEPQADAMLFLHTPVSEARSELSPVPERQVDLSFKPRAQVPRTSAKHRLDLMNGNTNLNRHRFYRQR